MNPKGFVAVLTVVCLSACGGGGGTSGAPGGGTIPGGGTSSKSVISISNLALAQSHVLPATGLHWTTSGGSGEALHMVGLRAALVLVDVSPSGLTNLQAEGRIGTTDLGAVPLLDNTALPPTESGGPPYSDTALVANVPASWIQPGLELRVTADSATASRWQAVDVGRDNDMTLRTLPFYLFGATTSQVPLSTAAAPPSDAIDEMFAKWPVTTLAAANHPAGHVEWPYLIVGPRADASGAPQPAYRAMSSNDYCDGFAGLATLHGIVRSMLVANGESGLPVQYFAPLIAADRSGVVHGAGGGIGGSSVGTGDTSYAGIFIHEQGHAFGLPHAGGSYDAGGFPYEWGSLKGSAWGFDALKYLMQPVFVPTSASRYANCASDSFGGHPRQVDSLGRCIKQDPMQSGSGDQASGNRFANFADFSVGVMQRWFEGRTTVAGDGTHSYSGGKLVADASFASGYKRWDGVDRAWVEAPTATTDGGLYGLHQNLPIASNVPVYAITVTMSHAGTANATQIYPPIRYTGNLLQLIDPTDATQRDSIRPDTSDNYWYCRGSGCDYTLRVTYANGSIRHVLLQGGFRSWFHEFDPPPAAASDPLDGKSFHRWCVNVPDDGDILNIQLLDTPMAWNGLPAIPAVLASR